MRLIIFVLFPLFSFSQLSDVEKINTVKEAENYAKENMWTEVITLPKEDAKWIFAGDDESETHIGQVKVVRNSVYKVIKDTTVTNISFAVVDFDPQNYSVDEIDSIRFKMIGYYRRSGSFQKMVDHYLAPTEKQKRYSVMTGMVGEFQEFFEEDMTSRSKGSVYLDQMPGGDGFKYIIFIREEPKKTDAFIILKSRLQD
jgi:hypothetical protein